MNVIHPTLVSAVAECRRQDLIDAAAKNRLVREARHSQRTQCRTSRRPSLVAKLAWSWR